MSILKRRFTSVYTQHIANKAFAFLCRTEYGFPVAEMGRYLGTSGPPMYIRIVGGEHLVRNDPWKKIFRNLRP